METARPESAIPSRAQALFPEAEFKLRHPLFQAMPYPLGADPRLLELENFVLKSLDPETSETLRHASIRYVGRWLNDSSFDVGVPLFIVRFRTVATPSIHAGFQSMSFGNPHECWTL